MWLTCLVFSRKWGWTKTHVRAGSGWADGMAGSTRGALASEVSCRGMLLMAERDGDEPMSNLQITLDFGGEGVGTESCSLTVILLQRRLLNRETGCGKKGQAGIFCLP